VRNGYHRLAVLGAAFATLVLLAGGLGALPRSEFDHGDPFQIKWQLSKHCCLACRAGATHKLCKRFCGKHSKEECDDFEGSGTGSGASPAPSTPKLEDQPCYPQCSDQCAKTITSMTTEQCIAYCLSRTRCKD
jgi:hypothetical protein